MINYAIEGRPADMAITTHVCRGNFRSTWISEGGYEPVAEVLFGTVNVDGYFLEYDTERAGGFEPLRFVPKGNKSVVLGLVTSKSGTLERKDDIRRRIGEAEKFVALDQLCLSPQCGFASNFMGNPVTLDDEKRKLSLVVETAREQWAKLKMIAELAREVWG
jgi:5-methyltetrahydropteroyltriglutamate--homocysteine methyltransferase